MTASLDRTGYDLSVRPADDLFGFVNGAWVAQNDIPADRARYGTFDALREQAERDVRAIIDEVAQSQPEAGSVAAKVGGLYTSFLDEDTVAQAGLAPIAALLEQAARVELDTVASFLGALTREGVSGVFLPFVNTDDRDPTRYVVYLEQGGLSLPDESYYHDPAHAEILADFPGHVSRMLALAGVPEPDAAAAAIVELEKLIAMGHRDKVANRDPVATYNLVDGAGLAALAPGFDWAAFTAGLQGPTDALESVVVRQTEHLTNVSALLENQDLDTWRSWLTWRIVHSFAPYLGPDLVAENFDFYGRRLTGATELRERWKRGVAVVEGALGEAVGQLYVERHFPPAAKASMDTLVANVVEAFRRSLSSVPWMGEATREAALEKLASFTPKVGYPAAWRDYSALEIIPGDLVGNVRRSAAFETDRELGKLGGPVDRDEWFMTPQTVNAYYNPGLNEIVFPAAILQPPFFDVQADAAENYGGIGAVIAHEIGHGFDDQGSQYDGSGTLRDWWTAEDRAAYNQRKDALIAQFNKLSTRDAPDRTINGALTVGENIGDLGGLAIGLAAYRVSLGDAPAPVIDDTTGDQRFFEAWARVWRGKARPEEAERLLSIDPHSPMDVRANAARNLDEFHEAFSVAPGDGMWVPPGERVRIF